MELAQVEHQTEAVPASKGARRKWFPIAWTVFTFGATAVYWLQDVGQDYKNFSLLIAYPVLFLGLSIWTIRSSRLPKVRRWATALAPWALPLAITRLGPIKLIPDGNMGIKGWEWRWTAAPDERLEQVGSKTSELIEWKTSPFDYPAFLGGGYWAEARASHIDVDQLAASPPEMMWRQEIGAGWSGFAIASDFAVTQEQRGEYELVTCYDLQRGGDPVWSHADKVRFDPGGKGELGGIGPRATPAIYDGRVYTHGAAGYVNCLDARSGELLWSHRTLCEFSTANLVWGKSASPLIVDDMVIIAVGGEGCTLVAYDCTSGEQLWTAGDRRSSHASPVVTEIDGVRQILNIDEGFLTSRSFTDGAQLWEHPWPGNSDANPAASNPVPLDGDMVFLSKGYSEGAELVQATRNQSDQWTTRTLWKRPVLKTKMSNVVFRDGYAYGLDGGYLSCVEIATGRKKWKKRRAPEIGHGQIMIAGDHILVLSESGEVILVDLEPEAFREAASFPAIEGITWNTPALAGEHLVVRNSLEAACYKLPLLSRSDGADPEAPVAQQLTETREAP